MSLLRCIGFLSALLGFHLAHAAYVIADLQTPGEDPQVGTHIIVSGKGMEDGRSWLEIARTQALTYADKQHHGKIRIISAIMDPSDITVMKGWGYSNIRVEQQTFTDTQLVAAIEQVPSIASLDMIGHDGAILGFALEDYDHRFFMSALKSLSAYRSHFTKDSYVRLFGCNTGWNFAPAIAQYLHVPAAGSMTSEDIQFLHNNQTWYFDEDKMYPPGGNASVNRVSFGKHEACDHGSACHRLKTVTVAYDGKHGKYKGSVPFLKFFCGTVPQADCFRRMAISTQYLIGVVSVEGKPSPNDYARIIADQFCDAGANSAAYQDCLEKVMNHVLSPTPVLPPTFVPTQDAMLTCTFTKCQFVTKCTNDCDLIGDSSQPSTVFVDELDAYKQGYALWQ